MNEQRNGWFPNGNFTQILIKKDRELRKQEHSEAINKVRTYFLPCTSIYVICLQWPMSLDGEILFYPCWQRVKMSDYGIIKIIRVKLYIHTFQSVLRRNVIFTVLCFKVNDSKWFTCSWEPILLIRFKESFKANESPTNRPSVEKGVRNWNCAQG